MWILATYLIGAVATALLALHAIWRELKAGSSEDRVNDEQAGIFGKVVFAGIASVLAGMCWVLLLILILRSLRK